MSARSWRVGALAAAAAPTVVVMVIIGFGESQATQVLSIYGADWRPAFAFLNVYFRWMDFAGLGVPALATVPLIVPGRYRRTTTAVCGIAMGLLALAAAGMAVGLAVYRLPLLVTPPSIEWLRALCCLLAGFALIMASRGTPPAGERNGVRNHQ